VERARTGDAAAFAALVKPHLGLLYRIAARAAGNPALAEDAVQEALALVHRRLHRFRAGASFKAFVAAIAAKRARTLLRSERRRKAREVLDSRNDAPPTPADWAAASDMARTVSSVLAALPAKRQRVLLLRLDGGLSYEEIAQTVGTTEGSARVLVHLALRELEERLAPHREPRKPDAGESR
jgi:RNA polymerase sigma-70 factor, ECF subfamily